MYSMYVMFVMYECMYCMWFIHYNVSNICTCFCPLDMGLKIRGVNAIQDGRLWGQTTVASGPRSCSKPVTSWFLSPQQSRGARNSFELAGRRVPCWNYGQQFQRHQREFHGKQAETCQKYPSDKIVVSFEFLRLFVCGSHLGRVLDPNNR